MIRVTVDAQSMADLKAARDFISRNSNFDVSLGAVFSAMIKQRDFQLVDQTAEQSTQLATSELDMGALAKLIGERHGLNLSLEVGPGQSSHGGGEGDLEKEAEETRKWAEKQNRRKTTEA